MTDKPEDVADNKADAQPTTEPTEPIEDNNSQEPENSEKQPKVQEVENDYLGDNSEKGINWEQRYNDSSTEAKKLAEERKQLQQAMSNLERLAQANPRILAEIEAAQGLANQSGFSTANIDNSNIVQQQVNAALEPIKKIAEELQTNTKKEKAQLFAGFEQKNPLPFPKGATKEQQKSIRQSFAKTAEFIAENQGISLKEAVSRAYLTLNPQAAIQKGKDEAYLESQSDSLAGFSSQTSAEGKQTKVKYTKAELERAKRLDPTGKLYKSMLNEK